MRCPRADTARHGQAPTLPAEPPDPREVKSAVAQLSGRHLGIVYRSLYLRQTTAQIAVDLGIDDRLVKQDLHDALRALRTALQGD